MARRGCGQARPSKEGGSGRTARRLGVPASKVAAREQEQSHFTSGMMPQAFALSTPSPTGACFAPAKHRLAAGLRRLERGV